VVTPWSQDNGEQRCTAAAGGVQRPLAKRPLTCDNGARKPQYKTLPGGSDSGFNTHAAAHNIINMTRIPAELGLAGAGLEYLPMDPFASGTFPGRPARAARPVLL